MEQGNDTPPVTPPPLPPMSVLPMPPTSVPPVSVPPVSMPPVSMPPQMPIPPQIPAPPVQPSLAPLILALIALVCGFVPILGMLSVPVALVAFFLALGSLLRARKQRPQSSLRRPAFGLLFSVAGVVVGCWQARNFYFNTIGATNQEIVWEHGGLPPNGGRASDGFHWAARRDCAVRQGNLQVSIVSDKSFTVPGGYSRLTAATATNPSTSPATGPTTSPSSFSTVVHYVTIELKHVGSPGAAPIDYRSWRTRDGVPGSIHPNAGDGTLEEDIGWSFKRMRPPPPKPVVTPGIPDGGIAGARLQAGEVIRDVLVFEVYDSSMPVPLRLDLPAERFGGIGKLRIMLRP